MSDSHAPFPTVSVRLVAALLFAASVSAAAESATMTLDKIAHSYVELALAIGEHDPNYVDAYYGSEELRAKVQADKADLPDACAARRRARGCGRGLAAARGRHGLRPPGAPARLPATAARKRGCADRAAARPEDELRRGVQGALRRGRTAPRRGVLPGAARPDRGGARDAASNPWHIAAVGAWLAARPGRGAAYAGDDPAREAGRRLGACDRRVSGTERHARRAPRGREFHRRAGDRQAGGGYNWYQGGYRSVIQVNVSPSNLDRQGASISPATRVILGHHLYNALLERELVRGRGWPEFEVYPLFSPQSLIAEGTSQLRRSSWRSRPGSGSRSSATYSFRSPASTRGLPGHTHACASCWRSSPTLATKRDAVISTVPSMLLPRRSGSSATRSSPRSALQQGVHFFDTYRSYVINYNLGQDLVQRHVEARAAAAGSDPATLAQRKWRAFVELISSPRLPSGLEGGLAVAARRSREPFDRLGRSHCG